jgi:hypothetical protein
MACCREMCCNSMYSKNSEVFLLILLKKYYEVTPSYKIQKLKGKSGMQFQFCTKNKQNSFNYSLWSIFQCLGKIKVSKMLYEYCIVITQQPMLYINFIIVTRNVSYFSTTYFKLICILIHIHCLLRMFDVMQSSTTS